ncbi:MAG: biotin transporter BioY [Chlamydiales bacterium]|nr:biotin transporter BioY [Chlamydiales bacterium]
MAIVLRAANVMETAWFQALSGCVWIALCSLIWVEHSPVSFTMQSFGLMLVAFYQKPEVAFLSGLFYLIAASIGLPVLCGESIPLWFFSPSGGYLMGFPVAMYLISRFASHQMGAVILGHIAIYTLGFIWLAHFIGMKTAFVNGVLLFIPTGIAKGLLVITIVKAVPPWGVKELD